MYQMQPREARVSFSIHSVNHWFLIGNNGYVLLRFILWKVGVTRLDGVPPLDGESGV